MSGEFYKNDSLHVILKRIQLTGYPHKVIIIIKIFNMLSEPSLFKD